jgi:adenylosuccinate lyase
VAGYATRSMNGLLAGLEVDAERMARNLDLLGGMVHSEALLLAMIAKGADRQEAYRLVQGAAKRAWSGESSFRDELRGDEAVARWLSADEVEGAMTIQPHLDGIETTYRALGLGGGGEAGT